MKILIFLFFLCFQINAFASTLENHLKTHLSHEPVSDLQLDAFFSVAFTEKEDFEGIRSQLFPYKLEPTLFHHFTRQGLPQDLISKYCSSNVSPQLLAETLTHLSIYKYCIEKKMDKILLINARAEVKDSPKILNKILKDLDKTDPHWDILFTDVDYHNSNNGDLVFPQIVKNGQVEPHKKKISDNLSKVFCRYGATAFVISKRGMIKIYGALTKGWLDLPFDQVIFKIPGINCYAVNSDIITNRYKEKITDPLASVDDEVHIERKNYAIGKEFWIEPIELLTNARFDIMAKYIYAKYHLNQYNTNWHISLYKDHIGKWNNFYEGDPLKVGFKAFKDSFDSLLAKLKTNGFDPNAQAVPINTQGCALNGSHRIASCLALNIPIKVKVTHQSSNNLRRSSFAKTMRQQHGVQEQFLDHMAYEYAKLKTNSFVVCLFPVAFQQYKAVEKLLSNYGDIVHSKDLNFNEQGALEVIRLLYFNENWIGNFGNNFSQGRVKSQLTFPPNTFGINPMRIYLYECKDLKTIREVKNKIRDLIQIGHDSVHINDTHEQTVRIAGTFFNNNSIEFMNQKRLVPLTNFDKLMPDLRAYIQNSEIDTDIVCVDSSGVLSAYGLRDCRDIDLLHHGKLPKNSTYQFDSHNGYLKYHDRGLHDILFNPNSYFFYQGVKFLDIRLLKKMKINRNEPKDREDVKLIDSI